MLRPMTHSSMAILLLGLLLLAAPPAGAQSDQAPPPDSALQIEELKDKLREDPYDGETHTRLGILYAQEDLLEEARAEFIAALQAAPNAPASHKNLGLVLLRMERWDEAATALGNYARMTAIEAEGHDLAGSAYEGKGDLERAREIWIEGSRTEGMPVGESVKLVARAAKTHLDAEEFQAATDLLDQTPLLVAAPEAEVLREQLAFAQLALAREAKDAGDAETALKAYARAREVGTDLAAAYNQPVEMLLESGELDAAGRILSEARAKLPEGDATLPYLEGRLAEQRGDLQKAARQYRLVTDLKPDYPGVHAALGEVLAQLGDTRGAQEALGRAVERGEGGAAASYNMGVMLSKSEKYSEAIGHLRAAVEGDPTRKDAHRALGTAYRKTKRYAEAARVYQGILDRFGPDSRDIYQLAYCQAKNDDQAGAAQNYGLVTALEPDNYNAWMGLGSSQNKLSRYEEAAEAFGRAIALQPRSELAQYNLAFAYQKQGRYEEAIEAYEKALELKETYRSYVNIAICWKELGEDDLSDDYYRRAAERRGGGR